MTSVAVATSSQLAADAAYEVAAEGGNAVDCALAASLLSMNTEPGVCALAGGAYITIWRGGEMALTIDGNVAVPGQGRSNKPRPLGVSPVSMKYGGGIETLVGPGAVAIPGSLAAIELAWKKYGSVSWRSIFEPTIRATRDGFPLPAACHYYLGYSGDCIFSRSSDGHTALHNADGSLRAAGRSIVVPHLGDTLDSIAAEGAKLFYNGELANMLVQHCEQGNGLLTRNDLSSYRAIERRPLLAEIGEWQIATNPSPAIGGTLLTAMLITCRQIKETQWTESSLRHLIHSQQACLDYRKHKLDLAEDVHRVAEALIDSARNGQLLSRWASASTVHTSAVDSSGTGCSITASSGYGSGEMPAGTGLWLNNCLGEIELNRRGLDAGPPGSRLPSNMAPCVARRKGAVLAVGSPGADRITTALQQFLINHLQFDMSLEQAIAHPRVHIDTSGDTTRLMAEAGLELPETRMPATIFPDRVMYFGGVGAARYDAVDGLSSAADPRREGGTCLYG